jgi:RND family efflux transporter MFP subunit
MQTQKNFLALLAATMLLFACEEPAKQATNSSSAEIIAVKTYSLQSTEQNLSIIGTGMLSTENEAKYSFKIGGVIEKVFVREGEFFKAGALLASLKINEIDAGFVQAKLGVEKAERDLTRINNLYKDSVATLEQLQNTRTAYEVAKKQLEAVAFNRSYAYIYATTDGFVTKKLASDGEVIEAGSPVLAINEAKSNTWLLKVGLSDREWAMLEAGDKAIVELDAYPNTPIKATVFRKSQAADMASGSFQVELQLENTNLKLALGMFGKAFIATQKKNTYQSIPHEAIVEANGKSAFVFVPLQGGKVKKQAIEIAEFDNKVAKVKTGLEGIQEVVLSNSAFLNENSSIKIIK